MINRRHQECFHKYNRFSLTKMIFFFFKKYPITKRILGHQESFHKCNVFFFNYKKSRKIPYNLENSFQASNNFWNPSKHQHRTLVSSPHEYAITYCSMWSPQVMQCLLAILCAHTDYATHVTQPTSIP